MFIAAARAAKAADGAVRTSAQALGARQAAMLVELAAKTALDAPLPPGLEGVLTRKQLVALAAAVAAYAAVLAATLPAGATGAAALTGVITLPAFGLAVAALLLAGGYGTVTLAAIAAPLGLFLAPVVGVLLVAFVALVALSPDMIVGAEAVRDAVLPAVEKALEPIPAPLRRPGLEPAPDTIDLDAVYANVTPESWMLLSLPDPPDVSDPPGPFHRLFKVERVVETGRSEFGMNAKTTRAVVSGAPDELARLSQRRVTLADQTELVISTLREATVLAESEELEVAEEPITAPVSGVEIVLDRVVTGLEPGRRLIVTGKRARVRYEVTDALTGAPWTGGKAGGAPGSWPPFANNPFGIPMDFGADAGGPSMPIVTVVYEPAAADDETVSELVTLRTATLPAANPRHTTLELMDPLVNVYDRTTTFVYANVARATHGETVAEEVLGSGDGSQPYQRFVLRQPPLTHVGAANARGTASTLEVRVNGVRWQEAPTLHGRGAHDRVYVARLAEDGRTIVQFGDGATGARLPTGRDNVRAGYRKGLGRAGLIPAGRLNVLMAPPLGVRDVTNPLDATGGDDAESTARARESTPITVLTLDRVVSLRDYEDFARGYAGIAKALATWIWHGGQRSVLVTVAGPDGAAVPASSDLYRNLLAALQGAGDPYVAVRVVSYRPAGFRVAGTIRRHPDHLAATVAAAVRAAVATRFAFEARAFGQPVTLDEVFAVIQAAPGVVMVDVDAFHRTDPATIEARLLASAPSVDADGTINAAELLTVDRSSLSALTVLPV
ncbi:MAG: putative baseplate assembly protein [Candidatus Rokubacteria bacterium]|nr:putative baseplate assembly protein [Candidatus Rokubacteria bacterium]